MKCEKCPYLPSRSEAGDYPDCYASEEDQREFKDGSYGCRFTLKQLQRMDEQYSDYLGDMGDDMGVDMDFEARKWNIEYAISVMKHMIGMYPEGPRRAYKRHGKMFYRPYRNYFAGQNKYLDYFSGPLGLCQKWENDRFAFEHNAMVVKKMPYYALTRRGLDFLGRHIHVTIRDEEN